MSHEIERLAAACLFPGFEGTEPPEWIRRWLRDGLGGVVLYARNVENVEQLRALTAALRAERGDVLVAIDEEGGDVTRLEAKTGSSYPGNAALGAVDDAELTEQVAAAMGGDLAEAGINLDLAPVADVNTNPLNPVIGIRSFGAGAALVALHVAVFVRGLQGAGVAACAKHFPGHGDTAEDSHLQLPVVDSLSADALLPFRAAIEAGVQVVMTAHIRVRAVGEAPATTNHAIMQELLREKLGFDGLVMTDALEMRAISATVGVEEGAVQALAAGADALCLGHDLGEDSCTSISRTVVDAVRSGRISDSRLAEAAGRVHRTAAWAALPGTVDRVDRDVGLAAARRALRCDGNVALSRPPLVVELTPEPSMAAGRLAQGPGDWFRDAVPESEVVHLYDWPPAPGVPGGRDGRQLVIVVRDAHRHVWQQEAVEDLVAASGGDAVVIELGLPRWRNPGGGAYIATFGAGRVNVEAAAERLYSGSRRGVEQSGSSPGS